MPSDFKRIHAGTVFGVSCAVSGPPMVFGDHITTQEILWRIPAIVLFNLSNLLIFDLANQRMWESLLEDQLNKPWRPIPQGLMSRTEVRLAMQLLIPAVLALNHWFLNVGAETACLLTATWVYNDLKACDDGWIQRNFMAALGSWIYNRVSLKVAIGGEGLSTAGITRTGDVWLLVTSGVIMTTMHVQDLKDVVGDKSRGRGTAPLVLGERVTRWTLAVPVLLWSPICALVLSAWVAAIPAMVLGTYVAFRCVLRNGKEEDKWTWQVWCGWTAVLYFIPLLNFQQLCFLSREIV
ncbi:prenyltransferase family-domain-containing protein [Rutstroemia sp. NJR-2017a WRK4]|nr:prenyltransferase family-domain-containing protein [Rutstroemia sp. NJR-2017a WRK4]